MSLDIEVLNDVAAELGVDAAFVEKDWYACQVLKAVSSIRSDKITIIFSGGTCLSKGYGIIQRFSEDLDFRCRYDVELSGNQQKKSRSEIREKILQCIQDLGIFIIDEDHLVVASNYIKFQLFYKTVVMQHEALRSHLEVEFSFTQPQLQPTSKSIASFLKAFTSGKYDATLPCLAPVEIASDKLSALCWRVIRRDRGRANDDPTLVRHLHDLCALREEINKNFSSFIRLVEKSFDLDQNSAARQTGMPLVESIKVMIQMVEKDALYKEEYQRFVDAMSYAEDEASIGYEQAVEAIKALYRICKTSSV